MKKIFVLSLGLFPLLLHAQYTPTSSEIYATALQANFASMTLPSVPDFTTKAQTVGSQYLFETWVGGNVTDLEGHSFSEGYLFNYNKVTQNLYIRVRDSALALLVPKEQLKQISLSDGLNSYQLQRVASLDSNQFFNVLVRGEKYSLYSLVKTRFVASEFFTNGVSSSGNPYDEFRDERIYYVQFANGRIQELPLKRKAVKAVFESEKEKVSAFFRNYNDADHPFDEVFLKSLVEYLGS
jgi:hypothetical protein